MYRITNNYFPHYSDLLLFLCNSSWDADFRAVSYAGTEHLHLQIIAAEFENKPDNEMS